MAFTLRKVGSPDRYASNRFTDDATSSFAHGRDNRIAIYT